MVTIFGAETKVTYCKNISNFVRIDQFVRDLQPNKILRPTDRQTLNCRMATKLTVIFKRKGDLYNKEKFIKIGAFFQKLQ